MVLRNIPIKTLFLHEDASSETFKNCMRFSCVSKSLQTFSQSISRCWIITPQSLDAPKYLLLAVMNSSVVTNFLLSRTFPKSGLSRAAVGRTLHTSSRVSRGYLTDLLSESFEIRLLYSKHPHWSVWYLCCSFFSEFNDPKHLYSWILVYQFL